MEIIKTKRRGRPNNYSGEPGALYLTIRSTRGTMTDETAEFLGLSNGGYAQFFIHNKKVYLSKPEENDDLSLFKKVSNINGRFGIFTKWLVETRKVVPGVYELIKAPVTIKDKSNVYYELKLNK